MTFGERLTELRKENGYKTRNEFAEKLSIPSTTLRNYETDVREPGHPFLIEIAEMFNVSVDYLLCLTDEKDRRITSQLKSSEFEHIKKYRDLDSHGKKMVDFTLDEEYKRWESEHQKSKEVEITEEKPPVRIIPYYQKIASAGPGQFVFDGLPIDMVEIPNVPKYKRVGFAIGVNGDSMEPEYSHGDKLLVEPAPYVDKGEVGIFLVDGACFVKEKGAVELISINNRRPNIPITTEAMCLGRVIDKVVSSESGDVDMGNELIMNILEKQMEDSSKDIMYEIEHLNPPSVHAQKRIQDIISKDIVPFKRKTDDK